MFDEFDFHVMAVLSALTALVNEAEVDGNKATVSVKRLYEAKAALESFEGSEFHTESLRNAVHRRLV